VTEDIESMQFNTAVSQMMIFVNTACANGGLEKKSFETFLTLLSPFAPHLAEELYASLGGEGMVATRAWPVFDAELARVREVTIGVQVNGKVRGSVTIAPDASESDARRLAEGEPLVSKYLQGKSVIKFVYVPARIINFVVN
ncbi:class I tRNA ligase family protein, partial [Candidatus Uhrbacteria bacterium]|nr:class I tRNA ligase family protein [Candidatus Uhrbacteria bacterium]